jgi:superfamily II DNA/RNA helicase
MNYNDKKIIVFNEYNSQTTAAYWNLLEAGINARIIHSGIKQIDREKSLQILMRINLLKRIESSVDSFRLTLQGIIQKIKGALFKLSNAKELETGEDFSEVENENFDWESNWGDQENIFGTTIKVHISDMDNRKWKGDLEEDLQILEDL